ncbi:MAG: NUDIX hydrolase, partial [Oscillospiraceae bacterium]
GKIAVREYIKHNGAVCIIALTDDNMIYLVRQFRYPFKRVELELPAGKIDEGEAPIDAAFRELEEEIGMKANSMEYLGEFLPTVAYSTEIIYIYVAKELIKSAQNLDEDEFINVELMPLDTLKKMILTGEVCDGKTMAAVLKYINLYNK